MTSVNRTPSYKSTSGGLRLPYIKKSKRSNKSSTRDHILQCNNNPSFDEFTILLHININYLLDIEESLLIKRNKLVLKKSISSANINLFDTA